MSSVIVFEEDIDLTIEERDEVSLVVEELVDEIVIEEKA